MNRFKLPNFKFVKIYSDKRREPTIYELTDINVDWKMGRREFLVLSAIGASMVSGCIDIFKQEKCEAGVRAHKGSVKSVSFSPDGKLLASGSGNIKLWEMPSGNLLKTIEGEEHKYVRSVSFSPDGKLLASGSGNIKLWDISSGNLLKTLEGDNYNEINSVSFSPDGKLLASGSNINIRLWEMPSGNLLKTMRGMSGYFSDDVLSVSFSPDGKLLASGTRALGTIKLWEMPSGKFLNCLSDPADTVEPVKERETSSVRRGTLPCGAQIPAGAICTCNCVV